MHRLYQLANQGKDPHANIVVSPSDHIVTNANEFRRVITSALKFTGETDSIVTLGMKPTRPETGYGYIQADLRTPSARNKEIFRVDQFRENQIWRQLLNMFKIRVSSGMPVSS